LDGLEVIFADGLNCIIGPRGAGKTTAVELIRFALDSMPGREGDPLRTRLESLIESNLENGRVELEVESKDGLGYSITRVHGEQPLVIDQDGHSIPGIKVRGGVLFQADVFSQNQMESIAEMPHYQLDLIDKFSEADLAAIHWKIQESRNELEASAAALLPLMERREILEGDLRELPVVESKLSGLKETIGPKADMINKAHAEKALRDREDRAIKEASRVIADVLAGTKQYFGVLSTHFDSLFTEDIQDGPNGAVFKKVAVDLAEAAREFDRHLAAASDSLGAAHSALGKEKSLLDEAHKKQEMAFLKLVEKHKDAMANSTERSAQEKRRNELLFKKREIADISRRIGKQLTARGDLVEKQRRLCDERFQVRSAIASDLTTKLAPSVRVRFEQHGIRTAYREHLEAALRGSPIKNNIVAGRIAASVSPDELVQLIKRGDLNAAAEQCGISDRQATTVMSVLNRPEELFALELVMLEDEPFIELSERGDYRESSILSTGQKCTAILPILLFDSINPLLIDQPEDNLDNSYIYETVVETLRKVKQSRQLIFVTHNPNIPVLGDAALVVVMGSDGNIAKITAQGSVDDCKEDIVTLLEGGEEAFKARKDRYHY